MSLLRLKEILDDKGFTGKALANTLGVTPNTVSNWVKGKSTPSGDDLLRIAKALDVDVRDLFHSTKKKEADEILRQIINDLQVVYSNIKK